MSRKDDNRENFVKFFDFILSKDFESIQRMDWSPNQDIEIGVKYYRKEKPKKKVDQPVLRRDSFRDRICDDLCQFILSFLSFEDKVRLQCVCKRFKRTILRKQANLVIRYANHQLITIYLKSCLFISSLGQNHSESETEDEDESNYDYTDKFYTRKVGFKYRALKSVIEMCPYIQSVDIRNNYTNFYESNGILSLIMKKCQYLKEFKFIFGYIEVKLRDEFVNRFGHRLSALKYYCKARNDNDNDNGKVLANSFESYPHNIDCLNRFPNLTRLELFGHFNSDPNLNRDKPLLVKNLKELFLKDCWDTNVFNAIIDSNRNSLVKISLEVTESNQVIAERVLVRLVELKNLRDLTIELYYCHYDNDSLKGLTDLIENIAVVCQQIKSLKLKFQSQLKSDCVKVYETVRNFHRLKRLNLKLNWRSNDTEYRMTNRSLKNCKDITHLKCNVSDLLVKVGHHLPKLQFIKIYVENMSQISDLLACNLSMLQCVKIYLAGKCDDCDLFVNFNNVLERMPKINKFLVYQWNDRSYQPIWWL